MFTLVTDFAIMTTKHYDIYTLMCKVPIVRLHY